MTGPTDSTPPEFHFGLPPEVEAILGAEIDDLDEWQQLEALMSEVAFLHEERQAASGAGQEAEGFSAALSFLAEDMTWGIDEPMTAADFVFLDEDDWPEP